MVSYCVDSYIPACFPQKPERFGVWKLCVYFETDSFKKECYSQFHHVKTVSNTHTYLHIPYWLVAVTVGVHSHVTIAEATLMTQLQS